MKLKETFILCLILISFLTGCTKKENNLNSEMEPVSEPVKAQQEVIKNETPVESKDKVVTGVKEIEPVPTDEGFSYGEWKFLNSINSYLPDCPYIVKTPGIESKVWILKDGEQFNPDDPPDSVRDFDAKGNQIKSISYTRDVSGDIYEYDSKNRLVSIIPIIDGKIRENKKTTLKYFKNTDGNILRKSYQSSKLVLEEIENKTENGWAYSWKEPDQNNFHRVVIIQKDGLIDEFIRYYASSGKTKYTFKYENNRLIRILETKTDGKSLVFTHEYFYREDGLLDKSHIIDHRKETDTILRQSTFSEYDENGNWRNDIVTFTDGGKETVIRRFTYAAE